MLDYNLITVTQTNFFSFCLAQHPSSAQILEEIGAVEFFTQMRQNCEDFLVPQVTEVLTTLLRVRRPPAPPSPAVARASSPSGMHAFTRVLYYRNMCFVCCFL